MKKSTRIVKRILALFLVVLMSIESFGAVVSDNDGSAFITKAEFDSLKNNFQSQIDQYNTSIDSKIDGAIASYLAGISVARTSALVNLLKIAEANDQKNVGFCVWKSPAEARNTVDIFALYSVGMSYGLQDYTTQGSSAFHGWWIVGNNRANGPNGNYVQYPNQLVGSVNGGSNTYYSALYYASFPFAAIDLINLNYQGNTSDWVLEDIKRWRCRFVLNANSVGFSAYLSTGFPTSKLSNLTVLVDFTSDANAKRQPTTFMGDAINIGFTAQRPNQTINHIWSVYAASDETANSFLGYNLAGNISGDTIAVGYDLRDYYSQNEQHTYEIKNLTESGSENSKYGFNISGHMHTSSTTAPPYQEWRNIYASGNGYSDKVWFNWKLNQQEKHQLQWANLTNKYYNGYFSEPYYKYNGIPICRTTKNPGKIKFKLKFKNGLVNSSSDSLDAFTYQIMDKKFSNGNMPTTDVEDEYNHVLKREDVQAGYTSYETNYIEIDKTKIFDTADGDYIYIKIEPSREGQVVSVSVVDDKIEYIEEL